MVGWRGAPVAAMLSLLLAADAARAQNAVALGPLMDFGMVTGRLMLENVNPELSKKSSIPGNRYVPVAEAIQSKLNDARNGAKIAGINFKIIEAQLLRKAVELPEPRARAAALIFAFGARKVGEWASREVLDQAYRDIYGIIKQAMIGSQVTAADLRMLSKEERRAKIGNLNLVSKTLTEVAGQIPNGRELIESASDSLDQDIALETLDRVEAVGSNVEAIRTQLERSTTALEGYRKSLNKHFDGVEASLKDLKSSSEDANKSLKELQTSVAGNTALVQAMAAISYEGWSTAQKLSAVESGMFPELRGAEKDKTISALKAQQKVEETIAVLEDSSNRFGQLATIAGNLGLPPRVVTGLQGAQVVAGSFAKFVSGDVLGGVAGLTSLIGFGGADPDSVRHAELMGYLDAQFGKIDERLVTIIDLQIQTLDAIRQLANAQAAFQVQVLGKLDKLEVDILKNQQLLQNILLESWGSCREFFQILNGKAEIPSKLVLLSVLRNDRLSTSVAGCFDRMSQFLNGNVKPASWAASIVDVNHFPTVPLPSDIALKQAIEAFQSSKSRAFSSTREFVLAWIRANNIPPARFLARLSRPTQSLRLSRILDDQLSRSENAKDLDELKCNSDKIVSLSLRELMCVGNVQFAAEPPKAQQMVTLLSAPLIGPQADWIIDLGIALSTIVDFGNRDHTGAFMFANVELVESVATTGVDRVLVDAVRQNKGRGLLSRLAWLTESAVLQQSMVSGDYVTGLVMQTLYDPKSRALNVSQDVLNADPLKASAFKAMRDNVTLARNVVLAAMARSVEDRLGNSSLAEAISYRKSNYRRALENFWTLGGCVKVNDAIEQLRWVRLNELFPNWRFEYRASEAEKTSETLVEAQIPDLADSRFPIKTLVADCPPSTADIFDVTTPTNTRESPGSGFVVVLGDIYVILPSPAVFAEGLLTQDNGLTVALANRDRVAQALVDRDVANVLREESMVDADPNRSFEDMSSELLINAK